MRKFCLLFLIVLLILSFPGCQQSSISSLPSEPTMVTEPEAAPAPELAAFTAILDGTQSFLFPETNESLTISQISRLFTTEDLPWTVESLSVLDLDGDGRLEAVLEVSNSMGFVILRYFESGSVQATPLWYRAFQELKADGSYLSSGSASNHSYFQTRSGGDLLLAECYESDGTMVYRVDGQEADASVFAAFETRQAQKTPAPWYATWQDYLSANPIR